MIQCRRFITDGEREAMRYAYVRRVPLEKIQRAFGCHRTTIQRLARREGWAEEREAKDTTTLLEALEIRDEADTKARAA